MLVLQSDLVERSQTMEEAQLEDPTSMKFTWKIDNLTTLRSRKVYSDIFIVGGYKWRILICPEGNNNVGWFSMYLNVADSETMPYGWSRYAQFSLAIVNQIHNKDSIRKNTQHQFNTRESDFGFTSFMPLVELHDRNRGYLVNDTVFIEAEIRLKKEEEEEEKKDVRRCKVQVDHHTIIKVSRDEDLEKQIGRTYFDLVDHEKVCSFRVKKQTPFLLFKEEVAQKFGIPVQFQRFWFWAMRQNHTYRPCRPLAPQEESQSVEQLREVSDKLHSKGHLNLFLEVEFGPDLRPIPPPRKTKEDIMLFFKLYEPEKQKLSFVGRLFVKSSSKPIEILAKLNQLAGFAPEEEIVLYEEVLFELCLLCEPIDRTASFQLSQIEDGDIICFQKSTPLESDEKHKYSDIPSFLTRMKKEQEEEDKKRYKAHAHLYTIIKVARDEDLVKQIGRDIFFDLVDHDKVNSFTIKKQTPFNLFKGLVAQEFGIPMQFQRFWIWAKRQNHTYRPIRPLTSEEQLESVEKLEGLPNKAHKNSGLKLYLEVEFGLDRRPIPLPDKNKGDILLFFKLYEPEKRELRFVGRFFVKSFSKPVEILAKLNQLAGFAPEEEIELYEEIKFDPCIMCEHIHKWKSFRLSQIEDGDIICFQKSTPLESETAYKYADVPSFLDYVHNRQIDTVRYLENLKEVDSSAVNQDSDQLNLIPVSTALIPATMDTSQTQEQADVTVLPEARVDEIPAFTMSLTTTWTPPATPPGEAAQVTLESMATDFGHATASRKIDTQNDAHQVPVSSVQDLAGSSPKDDDLTLRRLSAAEELLKSTSTSEPSAEALAALNTVTCHARNNLASLCKDGAYEEFKAALQLLTEQGMIPSRITSMLKDLLASLEGDMPKFVAAEKEFSQGGEVFASQHEEIKARMELAMQKCKESKDIVSNYDAKVEELEAELARVKEERAEAMESLKSAVDEMEPLKQSFADSSSKSEDFIVSQATLTLQKCGPVGTWVVVQDLLKKYFKF